MSSSLRYSSLALAVGIAGAFLAVATYGFAAPIAVSLDFAVSIGVVVAGGLMVYEGMRRARIGFPIIGGLVAVVAAWTIVAALVFPTMTALWLGFASALAYCGLAIGGLVLGEVTTERVVHHLRVGEEAEAEEPAGHPGAVA